MDIQQKIIADKLNQNLSRDAENKRLRKDIEAAVNDLSAIWSHLNGDNPHWGYATELVLTVKNYLTDTLAEKG